MIQSVAMNQANGFWVNTKRTLFMASLYFRLIRNYEPDEDVLDECNRLFYLVNNPRALLLPVMMSRALWNRSSVDAAVEQFSQGRDKMAIEAIYGTMPRWLRYIDRETILRDAEKVFRKAEQVHGIA
jgi:hypothetical protein